MFKTYFHVLSPGLNTKETLLLLHACLNLNLLVLANFVSLRQIDLGIRPYIDCNAVLV